MTQKNPQIIKKSIFRSLLLLAMLFYRLNVHVVKILADLP